MRTSTKALMRFAVCAAILPCRFACAAEVHGLIEVRAPFSDTRTSWTNAGLGKSQYDEDSDALRLGQAFLRLDSELTNDVSGSVVLNAYDDRDSIVDVTEAWIRWNPIPTGPWRTRVKVGAFFPVTSLEVGYDTVGWTPMRTVSSSAINSWLGEEIRVVGVEAALLRRGAFAGSIHDVGVSVGIFGGNDPSGTLLAWRGWSIGDRISGLSEPLTLADLPVYRPDGTIALQRRDIHEFREIDGRPGYYLTASYTRSQWLELAVTHYDNRGRPLVVEGGQYSWRTRFQHVSARIQAPGKWEFLTQAMTGTTVMGANVVGVKFHAAYALVSHPFGKGGLSLRYDRFRTDEQDVIPSDPNAEHGTAWAFAYRRPLAHRLSFLGEALAVRSTRPARALLDEQPLQTERSLTVALRWEF